MTNNESHENSENEISFYSESNEFLDGQKWEKRLKKLVPERDLGSVIDLRESTQSAKMYRLAGMHNRQAKSVDDPEKNQVLNRYQYLSTQFHWLEEFIPRNKLDQILQLMAYSRTDRKIAKELAGLNLKDLSLILAFWELDVYPLGSYIVEEVLQDINDYLKTYSNGFKLRGHISVKDIQLAQEIILSDLYKLEFGKKSSVFHEFPPQALRYYRPLLKTFEENIPIDFATKIQKARVRRPDLIIPSSVYIWVVRKTLLKTMIPYLATRLEIEDVKILEIQAYTENFWNNVFHQKAIGDLPTIGYLLLETWQQANAKPLTVRLTSLHKVEKFKTRIKAYRKRFSEIMIESLPGSIKINGKKPKGKAKKALKIIKNNQEEIKIIKNKIKLIKSWLTQIDSLNKEKMFKESAMLKEKYDTNVKKLEDYKVQLIKLKNAKNSQIDPEMAKNITSLLNSDPLDSFPESTKN